MVARLVLGALAALLLICLPSRIDRTVALQSNGCTATLTPGEDISAAIAGAAPRATLCLAAGEHRPFVVRSTAPRGLTVQGIGAGTVVAGSETEPAVTIEAEGFTLTDVTLRGGSPAALYARDARSLTLRDVAVGQTAVGLLLDEGTEARLEDSTISGTTGAGVVLRGRATAMVTRLNVDAAGGIGVAAILDGARLTIVGGRIEGGAGPAVFAGVPGCAVVGLGTIETPRCFTDNPEGYVADSRVALADVTINDGPGRGVVAFPGAQVDLLRTAVNGRLEGGLFAWGARATITESVFDSNWGSGVELRGYPDAAGGTVVQAAGAIRRTTIRSTRRPDGTPLGDGIVARGSHVSVIDSEVVTGQGNGIAMLAGTTGEVSLNHVQDNGGDGICFARESMILAAGNDLSGNRTDLITDCPHPP
ncbi:MAG: right-handed parallel beta-helix repeat-containing protein [Dehalococcoidia bacterium]